MNGPLLQATEQDLHRVPVERRLKKNSAEPNTDPESLTRMDHAMIMDSHDAVHMHYPAGIPDRTYPFPARAHGCHDWPILTHKSRAARVRLPSLLQIKE